MKEKELKKLLATGETETTEFKENFEKESIETAVAFANTKQEFLSHSLKNIRDSE